MIISTDFVNVPTRTIDSSWTIDYNDLILTDKCVISLVTNNMVKEINRDMKKCASGTKARKHVKRRGQKL